MRTQAVFDIVTQHAGVGYQETLDVFLCQANALQEVHCWPYLVLNAIA